MNIYDKAKELGEMIAESPEMDALKKAEAKLASDEHGRNLMSEYKNLQIEVVKAVKEGKSSAEEMKKVLLEKQEEINNYETTGDFLKARMALERLMKAVNDVVIFSITGEEPCSHDNCSSCGGCK